jgi:hypothetical protein
MVVTGCSVAGLTTVYSWPVDWGMTRFLKVMPAGVACSGKGCS